MSGVIVARPALVSLEARLAALVGEHKEVAGAVAPITIITGSHVQHVYLRRMLARELGAIANVRFMTLLDVAAEMSMAAAPVSSTLSPPLPEAVHPLLVEWILERRADADAGAGATSAADSVTVAHMPAALTATLRDLREGSIPPSRLSTLRGRPWLGQLRQIAEAYQQELRRFDDRTAAFERAGSASVEQIAAAFAAGPVAIYGIYDANALQLRVVKQLAAARSVSLFLLWAAEPEALAFAGPTLRRLQAAGFGLDQEPAGSDPVPVVLPRAERIIFSAADRQAEVEECVRRVLEDVVEGVPVAEIAIVHRLDQAFDDAIGGVLRRAALPFYRASGVPVRRTPVGRAALGLLGLLYGEPQRSALLELLSSPCVSLRWLDAELTPRPVRWERLTKEVGMVRGWREFQHVLEMHLRLAEAGDEESESRAARALEIATLQRVVDAFAADSDHVSKIDGWLMQANAFIAILARVAPAQVEGEAFRTISDRLIGLAALDTAGRPARASDFRRAAESLIRQAVISGGYFQRDGIFVGNLAAVRFLRFQRVYLLECSERSFPPVIRQDPLLLDAERQGLSRTATHGGADAYVPLKRDRLDEERLLFELVCQAPRQRLTLSYPRQAMRSGTLRLPSSFLLDEAQSLAGEFLSAAALDRLGERWFERMPSRISFGRRRLTSPADPTVTALRAIDASDLRLHVLENGGRLAVGAVEELWPNLAAVRERRLARGKPAFGAYDGIIPAELAAAAGTLERDLSPTGLADYVTCPYRFFLSRVLRVRVQPEPEETLEIAPIERGNLVHRILEQVVARFLDSGSSWRQFLTTATDTLEVVLEEEFARLPEGIRGLPLSWTRIREQVASDVRTYLDLQLDAQRADASGPVRIEAPFAKIALPLPDADVADLPLTIAGRIDRVDRVAGAVRVIDYKTGALVREAATSYRSGKSFQLPLYLYAAAALEDVPLADCSAELHFVSERAEFVTVALSGAELAADSRLTEMLQTIRHGIGSGAFFYRPGPGKQNCAYCDYSTVCSGSVDKYAAKKRVGSRSLVDTHEDLLDDPTAARGRRR